MKRDDISEQTLQWYLILRMSKNGQRLCVCVCVCGIRRKSSHTLQKKKEEKNENTFSIVGITL